MREEKKVRISELTRMSRERELTEEQTRERARLLEEYLAEWRLGARQVLENTYIVDEKGNKRKLRQK